MMVTIKVSNIYSKVICRDKKVLDGLYQKFTISEDDGILLNVPVSKSFKSYRRFPQVTRFFNKAGRFPTGLLKEVTAEIEKNGLVFDLKDDRPNGGKLTDLSQISSEIFEGSSLPHSLYEYQLEAANLALAEQRGILKCATGGGKTLIFAAIIKSLQGKYKAIILMRSKSLIEQTFATFIAHGISNVGCVTGDHFDPAQITLCTIQSVHKLDDLIQTFQVLIIDEVHQFSSPHSVKVMRSFENATMRLGFSATPWKDDSAKHNTTLKSWIGPELCDIGVGYLQTKEVISKCIGWFHRVQCAGIDKKWYSFAEQNGIVSNDLFHQKILDIINNIEEGRIMILVSKLQHGDRLHSLIDDSYWIRGEDSMDERQKVLNLLVSSEKKKVVAILSSIGYVGINVSVHHLINACGGRSPLILVQKVGRGLRRAADKKILNYHDFMFEGNKYLEKHSQERLTKLRKEGHIVLAETEPGDAWKVNQSKMFDIDRTIIE